MPDGSDVRVRGEIPVEGDQLNANSSGQFCIMVWPPSASDSHLFDGYNSSGGSDSEHESSHWDRNPRTGHSRGAIKGQINLHGAQEGIRAGMKRVGLFRQGSQVNTLKPNRQNCKSLQCQVSMKKKPRKRRKSCNEVEKKKRVPVVDQYWAEMKGETLQTPTFESKPSDKKKIRNNLVEKEDCEAKYEKDTRNIENGIEDNKECYEKAAHFENGDDDNRLSEKEQKAMRNENIGKTNANIRLDKFEKDSLNEKYSLEMFQLSANIKKFTGENDQTEMLKKRKMKTLDVEDSVKVDRQGKDSSKEKNEVKVLTVEINGKRMEEIVTAEMDSRVEEFGQEEKLVVNIGQGKYGGKDVNRSHITLDNKMVDAIEKIRDAEQTQIKQVLDPQNDDQVEKLDPSKELVSLNKELLPFDEELHPFEGGLCPDDEGSKLTAEEKESSLGFEINDTTIELVESDSTLEFQTFEKSEQCWEQQEYETYNSIEENSFHFPSECFPLQDSLKSLSLENEHLDVRQSCPDFYRIYSLDSSRNSHDIVNRFMQLSCLERQEFSKQTKTRILETINIKSCKELELENSEEKFKEEENDGRKEAKEDEEEKLDSDGEKDDCHDDDGAEIDANKEEIDEASNGDEEAERIEEDSTIACHVISQVEGLEKIKKTDANESIDNAVEVNDSSDADVEIVEMVECDGTDIMNDDKDANVETIDAEEKDADEKENKIQAAIDGVEEDRVTSNDMIATDDKERKIEYQITLEIAKFGHTIGTDDADIDAEKGTGGESSTRKLGKHGNKKKKDRRKNKNKRRMFSKKLFAGYAQEKFTNKKPHFWRKMKRTPKPTLPNEKEVDKLAPRKGSHGRRYSIFGFRRFGRRCSSNSGGRYGNGSRGDNSGGNSRSNQRNNGDKNSRNHGNRSNKDNDDSNNNYNNYNNQGQGQGQYNPAGVRGMATRVTRSVQEVNVPPPDFKRFRKRHTELDNFDWLDTLGRAVEENQGPVFNMFERLRNGEDLCLSERLEHPDQLSDSAMQCSVCITVDSMLKHNANCLMIFNNCKMCVQIFSLICSHIVDCHKNPVNGCDIKICVSIRVSAGSEIRARMKTLWFQIRKKLARIFDGAEEDRVEPSNFPEEGRAYRPLRVSTSSGPLPSIPEGTPLSITNTSRSSSRVLSRKKSNLSNVEERQKSGVSEEEGSSSGPSENAAAGAQGVEEGELDLEEVDSKHGRYSRPETAYSRSDIPDESDAIPTSGEASVESTGSGHSGGSGQFGMATGTSRFISLPTGPPGHGEPYFPSFKDKPTGQKGIGEVVYANKHQLVVVVTIWEKFKLQYQFEKLAKHYTEEGVILPEFKSKLHIKGLRYQNEFQWVKVSHLGNGMTGKCHLAMDFETEFKFCAKEIHISNYEKEEIELWSELDHPYVVQVYGAIRHGEKIYILQEFIEGGCLTEAINIQRKLGRRLSQLTALRYFQQLLQVLKYLRSRNILHEDLKADNILLNKTTEGVSIKVADFGLARRCQGQVRGGTKPVGTQTQWSPEKAEARDGYGFAAEVWAAVCVLVHMLTGLPPWMQRYENLKALIVVIVEKSPPVEDIPRNIHEPIKDIIRRGFTVCQGQRPSAEEMLTHHAFRLLDEAPVLQSTSGFYSMLESVSSENNRIDYDPNEDLRQIYRDLVAESQAGTTGMTETRNNGSRQNSRRVSGIVDLRGEEVPYYSNDYRVYTVQNGGRDGNKGNGTLQVPVGQVLGAKKKQKSQSESTMLANSSSRSRLPSHPNDNIDPKAHIERFFDDLIDPTIPSQAQLNLVEYNPNLGSIESQKGNSGSRESSIEHLSSGTITEKLIPKFDKILPADIGEDVTDITVSDDEEQEENIFKNFDFELHVEQVRENYIPTVINNSADLSPGSRLASEPGSLSHGNSSEKRPEDQKTENTKESTNRSEGSPMNKNESTHAVFSMNVEDQLPSFNDDDLFKSGSPPKMNPELFLHQPGLGYNHTMQEIPEATGTPVLQINTESVPRVDPADQMLTPRRQRLDGLSLASPLQHSPRSTIPHSTSADSMQNYAISHSGMHLSQSAAKTPNALGISHNNHRVGAASHGRQMENLQYEPQQRNSQLSVQQTPLQHSQSQPYITLPRDNIHALPRDVQSAGSRISPGQVHGHSPRQHSSTQNVGSMHQMHIYDQGPMKFQGQGQAGQQNIQFQNYKGQPTTPGQNYRNPATSQGQLTTHGQDYRGLPISQGQGYRGLPISQGPSYSGQHIFPVSNQGGDQNPVPRQPTPEQGQYYLRPEMPREEYRLTENLNPHHSNTIGLSSMPNQYRGQQLPANPLSLHPMNSQTSAQRSGAHHNGARPKVPQLQQTRQIVTGTEYQSFLYERPNVPPTSVNTRITDPRHEQSAIGHAGRGPQYPAYLVQPKTPILNPVINPRPAAPVEGQRMDLRLDISKAQHAPETTALSHAQTAPVFSPPKTPKKSPDLHRTMSQVPVVHKSPSLVGITSSSSSMKDDKMSSSTSKSQYEEQDDAFRQLGHTAEEALSQHSDPATRMFITDYDDDIDEEIKGEIDDSFLENPAESLAHMLNLEQDDSITVTFRSAVNGQGFSMKFLPKHTSKTWEQIITEELDGFSHVVVSDFGLQRFCLRRQDGSPIDLDSCLGNVSCTVLMAEATDSDPWWIEGGMISQ